MMKKLLSLFVFFAVLQTYAQLGWQEKTIINDTYGSTSPYRVVFQDMDNDNLADVVVGYSYGSLNWYKNLGGANFKRQSYQIVAGSTAWFHVADFNGDGIKDAVYVSTEGILYLTLGTASGTFGTPSVVQQSVSYLNSFYVWDSEGDGDIDIFYRNSSGTQIAVLKNDGTGIFTRTQVLGEVDFFYVTDINNDGLADIITDVGYYMYYNQQLPNGNFSRVETMSSFSQTEYFMAADVDNDGDRDVFTIYENGGNSRSINMFKNENNVFNNSVSVATLASLTYTTNGDDRNIEMADMDGDGFVDIVYSENNRNRIAWYKNLGNATFGTEQVISTTAYDTRGVALHNVDGIGGTDLVFFGRTYNALSLFTNDSGNGTLTYKGEIGGTIRSPRALSTGDIDGDGLPDMMVVSGGKALSWFKNVGGDDVYSDDQHIISLNLDYPQSGHIADLNNDGKNDIVATSYIDTTTDQYKIVWFPGTGGGNFGAQTQIMFSTTYQITLICTLDVDGDGDIDIIGPSATNQMALFKNNGNGTFAAAQLFNFTTSVQAGKIFAHDMDNDGDTDLLLTTSGTSGAVFWIENTNGLGDFSVKHDVVSGVAGCYYTDYNGDGIKDIIYITYTQGQVGWMQGDNQGNFGPQQALVTANKPRKVCAADFDGDGDVDLICDSETGYRMRWYQNQGDGAFGPALEIPGNSTGIGEMNIGDINADGKPDMYLYAGGQAKLAWYKNLGIYANTISGTVSTDYGMNGCTDGSRIAPQVLVSTTGAGVTRSTFTQPNGIYSFTADQGEYTTAIANIPIDFTGTPALHAATFAGINEQYTADFCLAPNNVFKDVYVSLYPITNARPGFAARYKLVIKNIGIEPYNGNITLTYPGAKLTFNTADTAVASQTANILTFAVNNLYAFQSAQIEVAFTVQPLPVTTLGERLELTLTDTNIGTDISPDNNTYIYKQPVVGSYDPNDMLVLEGEEVDIDQSADYLHYIIRFQNTGNHYAERVIVTSLIDDKLDWSSMQLESYSHKNRAEITDGAELKFVFDAIYLPGAVQNEPNSHGYVAFKVKPKPGIVVGDIVSGNASIYFDYNPAIITNTVATEYVEEVSGTGTQYADNIKVFPNPADSMLYIKADEGSYNVTVYNMLGQEVLREAGTTAINISGLQAGVYNVKITGDNGVQKTVNVLKK